MFKNIATKNNSRGLITTVVLIAAVWLFLNPADAHEGHDVKTGKHFLWSVETGDNTIYLLGSIHILKKSAYPLPHEFEDAYKKSDKVVFEADLDAGNSQEFQVRMMQLGMYPEGQALSENISRSTYELLKAKVTSAGLPMQQFDRFKPWFGALMLTSVELMKLGFDPNLGIDKHFFDRAKHDRKETVFLETNEYQINLFAGMSDSWQEILLRQMLKELEVVESMFADMENAWETGDADKLESILNISFNEYPDIYNRLIVERNKRWIPEIEGFVKQKGDVLIIVGAGHLVGKDSVVDLLKKKGYAVKQR